MLLSKGVARENLLGGGFPEFEKYGGFYKLLILKLFLSVLKFFSYFPLFRQF